MKNFTNLPQIEASDPSSSVWVMASAGTGKTKVLVDRLMKLLLEGAKPQKILCLTFTRAAANEIKLRINQEIAKWSCSSDTDIKLMLNKLFGANPEKALITKAKNLFSEISSLPEPTKICTIHAFCQHILKKFPIEARLSPTFRVLDKLLMNQMLETFKKNLFSSSIAKEALSFFAQNFHELTINNILRNLISNKYFTIIHKFSSAQEYEKHLSEQIGISISINKESIIDSYVQNIAIANCIKIQTENLKDLEIVNDLNTYLSFGKEEKIRKWNTLRPIFLKADGTQRSHIFSKQTRDKNLALTASIVKWQILFIEITKKIANYTTLKSSRYLYEIANALLKMYMDFKTKHDYLDYDDLIFFTSKLLGQSLDKEWVLYKLDGGIDHILIDESQDTSKEQWQIITNLIEDFFAGESRQVNRTVFIVGDEKQSIYSFQGADIDALNSTKYAIEQGMYNGQKPYRNVNLVHCYRSTQVILDFIQAALKESTANFEVPKILSARNTNLGRVEFWPLFAQANSQNAEFWPLPTLSNKSQPLNLAKIIALYIKDLLAKKIILPSTGFAIRESDITILVQRRNVFTNTLIAALNEEGLLVCGLDRIKLQSNLSVLDIIAFAKFTLLPFDDLNCAIVLKSPLFSLGENDFYELACDGAIWQKIQSSNCQKHEIICKELCQLISLSKSYSVFDFFFIALNQMQIRNLLLQKNGKSDDQVIDEFLQIAKGFENEIGGNLYKFLDWFVNNEVEVKRDNGAEQGIKIMTVHAAKGLESSVVIIPDSASLSVAENRICPVADDIVLFLPREKSEIVSKYKTLEEQKSYQEYLRLMYVAFSRCKDYLIICAQGIHKESDSWHSIAQKAMIKHSKNTRSELLCDLGIQGDIWVMQHKEFEVCTNAQRSPKLPQEVEILNKKWSQENLKQKYCEQLNISPLNQENSAARYGVIAHKLLEEAVNGASLHALIQSSLLFQIPELQRKELIFRLTKVLNADFWQNLLQDKTYTEVAFVDSKNDKNFVGRIDLLTISESKICIIDYKTDAFVPKNDEDTPKKYLEQMQRYKSSISKIYSNHKVSCYILWFEEGLLKEIHLQ